LTLRIGSAASEAAGGFAARPKIGSLIHARPYPMTTTQIDGVTVTTQANVYFDGKCVSHGITLADGTKKSVGVVLPASLSFGTAVPEVMECVAGGCEYKLAGSDTWLQARPGDRFSVPGSSSFDIRVSESFHYICHYG
jgi:uncharacterized protein YaiE (UPF0345 family)